MFESVSGTELNLLPKTRRPPQVLSSSVDGEELWKTRKWSVRFDLQDEAQFGQLLWKKLEMFHLAATVDIIAESFQYFLHSDACHTAPGLKRRGSRAQTLKYHVKLAQCPWVIQLSLWPGVVKVLWLGSQVVMKSVIIAKSFVIAAIGRGEKCCCKIICHCDHRLLWKVLALWPWVITKSDVIEATSPCEKCRHYGHVLLWKVLYLRPWVDLWLGRYHAVTLLWLTCIQPTSCDVATMWLWKVSF